MVSTNLIGAYNADNVLAALAAGSILECNRELSIKAIESYTPTNNRSQLLKGANNTLIVDAYNANPTSMKAALENFSQMEALSKGVVIGDMLELGNESEKEHRVILDIISNMNLDHIFIVGNEFAKAAQGNPFYAQNGFFAPTSDQLKEYLNNRKPTGTTILIKGSRGMRLEKVLDLLS
ncbi:UDP-N-acetylmuramoyl-tripeptide--D-alanyl-D-alanine ligase [bioreactor metagenome]|uniref:UDP-N-acetylmuramoyl-tripeptide--D-alanyl-D-alanine ligase n=1 Tax=bioreactor metagenome TaxID=1076179 RepID=A0A645FS37_9ZZZZ